MEEKLGEELQLTKIHSLLVRRGVRVPYRTLHRFCVQELGFGRGARPRLDDSRLRDLDWMRPGAG